MHSPEFRRNVGKLGAEVGRRFVRSKDVGQLAGYGQLSPQSNLQDRRTFCWVSHEPIGFISQPQLRSGDLLGHYE
jgi:hypothetical protein